VYWWAFVAAPKGTPPPVLQKISAALNDTLKDEKFRSRLAAMGVEPETQTTSAATRALVQSDVERWRGVVAKNATSK
jgi:tripartite-type tricarboxylate transporter receptor subunit TctC